MKKLFSWVFLVGIAAAVVRYATVAGQWHDADEAETSDDAGA